MDIKDVGLDWLLTGEPRPAQVEALARSYTGFAYREDQHAPPIRTALPHEGRPARGWGHFMQMRVGKTPTILNEFMLFKRDHNIRKAVVWSPNPYKFTWGLEIVQFGVDVPHHVHDGDADKLTAWVANNPEGMLIINYEAAAWDHVTKPIENWIAASDGKVYMAADESVKLKSNKRTGNAAKIRALGRMCDITRPATGKPAPQSPADYWGQLRFAKASGDRNYTAFTAAFVVKGGFKNKQVKEAKNPELLARLLRSHVFIAERKDWATHIESDYYGVPLEMTPKQKRLYGEMERNYVAELEEGKFVSVESAANAHCKLQQISSGWVYDELGVPQDFMPFNKTPKFMDLKERLSEQMSGKVIVLYHFRNTGEKLREALASFDPAIIGGQSLMKDLGKSVDEEKLQFNEDPNCRVMLGQVTAIKYGHTLMGNDSDPCLDLLYYENSYSLDDRSQTEERPQGNGQQGAIAIGDYFSSPVEKKVIESLQRKDNVYQTVVDHYKDL